MRDYTEISFIVGSVLCVLAFIGFLAFHEHGQRKERIECIRAGGSVYGGECRRP